MRILSNTKIQAHYTESYSMMTSVMTTTNVISQMYLSTLHIKDVVVYAVHWCRCFNVRYLVVLVWVRVKLLYPLWICRSFRTLFILVQRSS